MKKIYKSLLVLAAATLLISGCANTSNQGSNDNFLDGQSDVLNEPPQIAATSVTYYKDSGVDITVAINLFGNPIESVIRGIAALQEGVDYTCEGYKFVLKNAFLESCAVGTAPVLNIITSAGSCSLKVEVKASPVEPVVIVDPVAASESVNYDLASKKQLKVGIDFRGYRLAGVNVDNEDLLAGVDFLYSSTYVTFTYDYLNSLGVGEHNVNVASTSTGFTSFKITITKTEKIPSGDDEPEVKNPIIESNSFNFVKGASTNLNILVNYQGSKLLSVHAGAKDSAEILTRGEDYLFSQSSLILKTSYLDNLTVGTHTFTIVTENGDSAFVVDVKNQTSPVISEPPVVSSTSYTHSLGNENDIVVVVDFKGANTDSITIKENETLLTNSDYQVNTTSIKLLRTYLNTLSIGTHNLVLATSGGQTSFAVVVEDLIKPSPTVKAPEVISPTRDYILGSSTDLEFSVDYFNETVSSFEYSKGGATKVALGVGSDFEITESSLIIKKELLESSRFNVDSETLFTFYLTTVGGTSEIKVTVKPESKDGKLTRYNPSAVYKYTYGAMSEDEFPLQAYIAPMEERGHNTKAQYEVIKESGINTIQALYEPAGTFYTRNKQAIFNALDYAQDVGITYLVRNGNVGNLVTSGAYATEVAKYENYKSFGGFLYSDEPAANKFDQIGSAVKDAYALYPNYQLYVNLFPCYASGTQLSGTTTSITYDQFLTEFFEKVPTPYLAYDFYPQSGAFPGIRPEHYLQLQYAEKYASNNHVPFWPFLLSTSHMGYRLPNFADLNWQANTALAFGAKGLQYFTYEIPKDEDGFANATGGFIDRNGNKSSIFNDLKNVNLHILRMGKILMNSTVIKKFSIGSQVVSLDTSKTYNGGFGNVNEGFRELAQVSGSGSPLLVTMFDYGGKTAIFVCNSGLSGTANFNLKFKMHVETNCYTLSGVSQVSSNGSNQIAGSLGAGTSALYELTNYERAVL